MDKFVFFVVGNISLLLVSPSSTYLNVSFFLLNYIYLIYRSALAFCLCGLQLVFYCYILFFNCSVHVWAYWFWFYVTCDILVCILGKRSCCEFSEFFDETIQAIFSLMALPLTSPINIFGNGDMRHSRIRLTKYTKVTCFYKALNLTFKCV